MTDTSPVEAVDPALADLIAKDVERQRTHIQLIASENLISMAMMQVSGSVLNNKYSEGYPGRRYYEGCEVVDEIEQLAIDRAKVLFGAEHANVQAHSGSQANFGVYLALLEPGDTILDMRLDQGGHLTHGSPVNLSGKLFNVVGYGVDPDTELIDYDEVRRLAQQHRPKLIIAGYSAYSRIIDWSIFAEIAREVGAIFMVDAAHIIGLIAGGAHPNPVPHADIVTATTHKALRGPRGGVVLASDDYGRLIDKAIFPMGQGGAINSQIAAKALAFHLAAQPEFATYAAQVVANAAALADSMTAAGARIVSGGTDNHLFLTDLRSIDNDLTGKDAARLLDAHGVTLNFNTIPYDPRKPAIASGIRIGTPAVTTAGMRQPEMEELGTAIVGVLRDRDDAEALERHRTDIGKMIAEFPAYPADFPGHV